LSRIKELQKRLGVSFNNTGYLEEALIHSSYVNENAGANFVDNERLEFLGDSIIGLIFAEEFFKNSPHSDEGTLTRFRSHMVRKETLAKVSQRINLGEYLYLGHGEESGGGRKKTTNLAHVMEAIVAAVYLDQGLNATQKLVLNLFKPEIEQLSGSKFTTDYKSRLQELMQSRGRSSPTYRTVSSSGPDHNKQFTVEVICENKILGRGSGRSKKEAESEAARETLSHVEDLSEPS
jgi:ribonuclease-3